MQQYNNAFTAEDGEEELLMLAGRVEAVGAYLHYSDDIDKKVVSGMLGLNIFKENENMRVKETSSIDEVNALIRNGWKLHHIDRKGENIIFFMIKE